MRYSEHRNGNVAQHMLSHGSDKPAAQAPPAMRAHHDDIDAFLSNNSEQLLFNVADLDDRLKVHLGRIFPRHKVTDLTAAFAYCSFSISSNWVGMAYSNAEDSGTM